MNQIDYHIMGATTNTVSLLEEVARRWNALSKEEQELLDAKDFMYATLDELREEKADEVETDEVLPDVGW